MSDIDQPCDTRDLSRVQLIGVVLPIRYLIPSIQYTSPSNITIKPTADCCCPYSSAPRKGSGIMAVCNNQGV